MAEIHPLWPEPSDSSPEREQLRQAIATLGEATRGDVNSGPLPSALAARCLAPSAHKIAKMATFLSRFRGGTAFAR